MPVKFSGDKNYNVRMFRGTGSKIELFLVLPGRLFQYCAGRPSAIIVLPLYTDVYILSSVHLPELLLDLFYKKFWPAERIFNTCI